MMNWSMLRCTSPMAMQCRRITVMMMVSFNCIVWTNLFSNEFKIYKRNPRLKCDPYAPRTAIIFVVRMQNSLTGWLICSIFFNFLQFSTITINTAPYRDSFLPKPCPQQCSRVNVSFYCRLCSLLKSIMSKTKTSESNLMSAFHH